jgi:hypothetical protein
VNVTPEGTDDATFHAVLALLLAHELDAVERHEWRLLPVLRSLPDGIAGRLFVLLHVPLFLALFRLATHPSAGVRRRFRLALDAFAVVHAVLHRRFRDRPEYEFGGTTSRALIDGAALTGFAHLLLSIRGGERA